MIEIEGCICVVFAMHAACMPAPHLLSSASRPWARCDAVCCAAAPESAAPAAGAASAAATASGAPKADDGSASGRLPLPPAADGGKNLWSITLQIGRASLTLGMETTP